MRSIPLLLFLAVFFGCATYPIPQNNPSVTGSAGYGGTQSVPPAETLRQQQATASQWDPYGDVDAGPEIRSSRPREFARPAAEAVRARGFRDTRWPF